MVKALPIPDVAPETPLGAFAARVIEIRAGEVETMLGVPSRNGGAELVHDRREAIAEQLVRATAALELGR